MFGSHYPGKQHPIVSTIIAQLGGENFLTLIGATDLFGSPKGLAFCIPKTLQAHLKSDRRYSHIRIHFDNANDCYSVETIRVPGLMVRETVKVVSKLERIDAMNLRAAVDSVIGVRTSS